MRLDLQIQAQIISSLPSKKFGAMIHGQRQGDLGEEAHLTSACRLRVSSLISPPPTPAMAVRRRWQYDSHGVVSSGGMGGACRSILGGGGNGILAVPETEFSLPHLFGAPLLQSLVLATCVMQTPPFQALLVHPSWLYRFTFTPCVKQTPPLAACLAHPSWLQCFFVAPCVVQTPPLLDPLAHPLWLQCFTFAPCVTQTPPFLAPLAHPSWLQHFLVAPCALQMPPLLALLAHPLCLHSF